MAKFIVTKGYGNEVEVKLAWETKRKIKKIAFWTTYGACLTAGVVTGMRKKLSSEMPQE